MLSYEDAIRAVEAIERTIEVCTYGWANQAAIRAIEANLFALKTGQINAYVLEKMHIIESRMRDLYSPRKAQKWGGSESVKREILKACHSLKDQLRIIDQAGAWA